MSSSNGTARRRPAADTDAMLAYVAEYLTSADDDSRAWVRGGSKVAVHRTIVDLRAARLSARMLLEGTVYGDGNEFALGAAENRCNYAVGEAGLKYEAVSAPGTTADPALLAATQEYINAFGELADLPAKEWETVYRLDADGDCGLRLCDTGSVPEVRFVAAARINPPATLPEWWDVASDTDPGYGWGVVHPPGDRGRTLGYWVERYVGDEEPEFVPEAQMVFLKMNTDTDSPRGWPTWEPVINSLRQAEELTLAMSKCGVARAKIAVIEKIDGFRQEQADTIRDRLTQRTIYDGSGLPARIDTVEKMPYGARLRTGANSTFEFPTNALGSADLVEAVEANLRAAAARLSMPQWMFSTKTDVKYSNAFVTESPALRAFLRLQGLLVKRFGEGRLRERASLVWRAVRLGVRNGLLPAAVLTAVRIKCTPPSLEVRDKAGEASANVEYVNALIKDRATCQRELGYDPDELGPKVIAEAKVYGQLGKYSQPGAAGPPPAQPPAPPDGSPPDPAAESLRVEPVAEGGPATGSTFPGKGFDGPAPGWE